MLGRSAIEIGTWEEPRDRAAFVARLDAERSVVNFETRFRRADNKLIQVLVSGARVVLDGDSCVVWSWRDVTEQRIVEQFSRLADARYRALFESAVDGMAISRPDGVILDVNPAICQRFGYSRDELVGRKDVEFFNPQELARIPRRTDLTERWDRRERIVPARDGSGKATEIVAGPMPDGNVLSILRDITERKRAEQDLRRFRMAMDASADMILLVDRNTMKYVDANDTACALLGYTREELLAQPIENILPVSRAELEAAYDRQIADPSVPGGLTSYYRCKDGSRLPFESKRQVLRADGGWLISIVSRDIRERIRAAGALAESEARFRAVFERSTAGIATWGLDGRFLTVNGAFCEFVGYASEELVGKMSSGDLRAPGEDTGLDLSGKMLRGEIPFITRDRRYRRRDATTVWGRATVAGVRGKEGTLQYFIAVVIDITEARDARDRVDRINAELDERVQQRTAELRDVVKDLDAFTYSVSHDLRTPVGVVSNFAHLLRSSEGSRLSDDGKHLLAVIEQNSERMIGLIEGLLNLSRLGNTPIRHLPLSMSGLAREALQMSDHARNAEIVVGELPVCHGEPVLIGQVWANLIGNAFKYSRTRDPAKIEVGWDGGQQAYFVRDNGIGFDMQFAGKLFDAFERLHSEPAYEGSGIGLAIVGRIVQRHGGRIWADSAPEKGATFWFTLPA